MSELAYKRTNVYEVADEKLMKEIFDYAEGYKTFLDLIIYLPIQSSHRFLDLIRF